MEDEHVQLDVKICRMGTTLARLNRFAEELRKSENPLTFFNRETFPRGIFSAPQIVILREVYGAELPILFERILADPITMIVIMMNRINERYETVNEVRRNKESDYYDWNKRNYPRSRDVVKQDSQQQRQQAVTKGSIVTSSPDEIEKHMLFHKESVRATMEMLSRIAKAAKSRDISVTMFNDLMSILLKLK